MTRKYSIVERFVWRDPDVHRLDRLTKLLWIHFLTSGFSTNIPGLIPASLTMIADEMNEKFNAEFQRSAQILSDLGWLKVDSEARLIFLPNALRHNPPKSVNEIKGWGNSFDEIPESPLRDGWIDDLLQMNNGEHKGLIQGIFKPLRNPLGAPSDGLSKPLRTPDPDPSSRSRPRTETEPRAPAIEEQSQITDLILQP